MRTLLLIILSFIPAINWGQCSPGGTLNVPGSPDLYISSSACYSSITMANNGLLVVQSGVTLTIDGNVNAANGDGITVQSGGTLIINGTITTNNNFSLVVSGSSTIGNIDVNNNAIFSITGSGTVNVTTNVDAENNCSISVALGGNFNVGGDVSVGGGSSSVTVNGNFQITGQYTGPVPTGDGNMNDADQQFLANTLPVELIEFHSQCETNGVKLTWTTASEYNSSHYSVLHSSDGLLWEVIGEISAAGYSNENISYDFMSKNRAHLSGYFKLDQVDMDGVRKIYSEIYTNCKLSNILSAIPNPSHDNFTLILDGTALSDEEFSVRISDPNGKEIYNKKFSSSGKTMFLPIEITYPTNGIYFIHLVSGEYAEVIKHSVNK